MEKQESPSPRAKRNYKRRADGTKAIGRKEIPIDLMRVEKLSAFMYTEEELALGLGVSYAAFRYKRDADPLIVEAMQRGQAAGRCSLRAKQMQMAMKGDRTMLIWLGKQYLGQKEKFQHASDPEAPMPPPVHAITFASAEEAAAAFDAALKKR